MEAIFLDCGAGVPQLKRNPLGSGNQHAMRAILVLVSIALASCRQQASQRPHSAPEDPAAAAVYQYLLWAQDGKFDSAGAVYAGDWRARARDWFPHGDTLSAAGFLRNGCTTGLFLCYLTPRRVVEIRQMQSDTLLVVLELTDTTGARFEQPPCCGSTGKPQSQFSFTVVRDRLGFKVLNTPVYQP